MSRLADPPTAPNLPSELTHHPRRMRLTVLLALPCAAALSAPAGPRVTVLTIARVLGPTRGEVGEALVRAWANVLK